MWGKSLEATSHDAYQRYLQRVQDDVKASTLKPLEKYMTR